MKLSSLETALENYIMKNSLCHLIKHPRGHTMGYLQSVDFVWDAVVGAAGGRGFVRHALMSKDAGRKKEGHTAGDQQQPRMAWNENEKSYMVIYRQPVKLLPANNHSHQQQFLINEDIAFGHTKAETHTQTSVKKHSIQITSYEPSTKSFANGTEKGQVVYRQVYFTLTPEVYESIGDCGFWQWCNIDDMLTQRTEINKVFLNVEDATFPITFDPSVYVRVLGIGHEGQRTPPHEVFPPGSEVEIKCLNWSDKFIKKELMRNDRPVVLSSKIKSNEFIGIEEVPGFFAGVWEIQLEHPNITATVHGLLSLLHVKCYLHSPVTWETTERWKERMEGGVKQFGSELGQVKGLSPILDSQLYSQSEVIRITSTVRYTTNLFEFGHLESKSGVAYTALLALLGDESLLVNPLTGHGVSFGIKSAYSFSKNLFSLNNPFLFPNDKRHRVIEERLVKWRKYWEHNLRDVALNEGAVCIDQFVT
eukprot:CAMPEP_0174254882 /NCGR_PEP_ID=MMETSP0439-20130205/4227_1 /TAXON_ID=0 /ORGANISM="Stereomyxa ramosa, Strain Chinc5" /LENGTH=476 /DNA_ID=CAMNT_0015336763 /DNA_START=507 /DNA_END=1937 /DNA_ORIENTATION=-